VYSKFGHHPHPLGYLCARFRFFHDLRCWASPRRKIAYSLTHSLTHPAYLMPREQKLSLRNKAKYNSCSSGLWELWSYMVNTWWNRLWNRRCNGCKKAFNPLSQRPTHYITVNTARTGRAQGHGTIVLRD